jgi:periplasmic protein TonB
MREAVSDILVERAQEAEGLGRMVWVSLGAHVALLTLMVVMPQGWHQRPSQDLTPMIISLGGTPGPQTGGMTPIGGRPIQEVAPVAPRTAPVAPAPKLPEMVLPQERAQPRPRPATPATAAPPRATSRTPTRGAEVQEGSARADTGARGSNFGLTTGGGSGTGGYLDVGDFCCPDYLETMRQLIQSNWQSQQQVAGQAQVKFTIQRDGTLTGIQLEKSSGYFALDQAAQRALHGTQRLPPLPREFTESHLTVHLIFQYQR